MPRPPTTHALDWSEHGGYFTRCGYFTERAELMSDTPTCGRCRCWLGHHVWLNRAIDGELHCGVCGGITTAPLDGGLDGGGR